MKYSTSKFVFLVICLVGMMAASCSSSDSNIATPTDNSGNNGNPNNPDINDPGIDSPSTSDWLIPPSQVFDGGPGVDGIPSIDNPQYNSVLEVDFLEDDDLVIGIKQGDIIRGYPHQILDWHEITNSSISGALPLDYSMTYCPLTGTALAWNRNVNGQTTEFGVSGLLYNTNLLPYDRNTNSIWSQLRNDCVNGPAIGTEIETLRIIETTWKTFSTLFPNAEVLNRNTGFNRSYGVYPYGGYMTNSQLLFPVTNMDNRLHLKERVYGISIGNRATVYEFDTFGTDLEESIHVVNDEVNNIDVVVVGSNYQDFMVAFQRPFSLEFSAVNDNETVVMTDNEGNTWSIWGEALSGPRQGENLPLVNGYMGYWLAFPPFHSQVNIFE
ncbi:MAG: DUF3179 domain-containing protein [Saprospiraceae bacterium]|nr:DUF3179 domain-containing protein [Saprospiraceae bacterium]